MSRPNTPLPWVSALTSAPPKMPYKPLRKYSASLPAPISVPPTLAIRKGLLRPLVSTIVGVSASYDSGLSVDLVKEGEGRFSFRTSTPFSLFIAI